MLSTRSITRYYFRMHRTVTRVHPDGTPIEEIDILVAHTAPGILHRAFSVFVFSPDRTKLMLQKRFQGKPTFGGLWGNTCCSHQYEGESDTAAGERRLMEEMGFTVKLIQGASFVYQANDPRGNGMAEHEHDTILMGTASENTVVKLNPKEAEDWMWMTVADLKMNLSIHPEKYVPWLPIALKHIA